MGNNIGLCGRCRSGKTELANICVSLGYEKISFASHLKKLVAKLLKCNIEEVNLLKEANFEYICDEFDCKFISKECNIPYQFIEELMLNKNFSNTRDMMQFIGTNVIRKYNNNWHVNKTREIIQNNLDKNFVIDDVRFENEVQLINEFNGDCWFVIRPFLENISNHASEKTLKWQNFENIIINDGKLELLKFKWKAFVENNYKEQMKRKKDLMEYINNHDDIISQIINNKQDELTTYDMMFISKHLFTYNPMFFQNFDIEEINIEDKKIEVKLNNQTYNIINPLEIEDIKLYL